MHASLKSILSIDCIWPNLNSSKLSCVSSLPAGLKKIQWRIAEKSDNVLPLSHYTMGIFSEAANSWGRWSDLTRFWTPPRSLACYHNLYVWKGSDENSREKSGKHIFRRPRAAYSVDSDQILPNFNLIQAIKYVIITFKYEEDPINTQLKLSPDMFDGGVSIWLDFDSFFKTMH